MAPVEMNIADVTPETKNWMVKVQVVEKCHPRQSLYSPGKYQRMVLRDDQDMRIQAFMKDNSIGLFDKTLNVGCAYYIKNARVRNVANPAKAMVPFKYQWEIDGRTVVQKISEESPANLASLSLQITPFTEFYKHVDANSQLDVVAIVIKAYPQRTATVGGEDNVVREFLIIDNNCLPALLTLWNEFVEQEGARLVTMLNTFPVIAATRLRVGSYRTISLSTRATSSFYINPNIPEARILKTWAIENQDTLATFAREKIHDFGVYLMPDSARKYVAISDVLLSASGAKYFWVVATPSILKTDQQFSYVGCAVCGRSINVEEGSTYMCMYCQEEVVAKRRCTFELELSDGTGVLNAVVFGEEAEKILKMPVASLTTQISLGQLDLAQLQADVNCQELSFKIKHQVQKFQQLGSVAFVIQAVDSVPGSSTEMQPAKRARKLNFEEEPVLENQAIVQSPLHSVTKTLSFENSGALAASGSSRKAKDSGENVDVFVSGGTGSVHENVTNVVPAVPPRDSTVVDSLHVQTPHKHSAVTVKQTQVKHPNFALKTTSAAADIIEAELKHMNKQKNEDRSMPNRNMQKFDISAVKIKQEKMEANEASIVKTRNLRSTKSKMEDTN